MPAQTLETQIRVRPGVAIIDLRGEIDAAAEYAMNAAYAAATGPVQAASAAPAAPAAGAAPAAPAAPAGQAGPGSQPAVALNFAGVNYINSTGIALIVGLLAQARKTGRRVLIYGLSDHYVEIFRITRLADFVTLCEDESAALAEINRS